MRDHTTGPSDGHRHGQPRCIRGAVALLLILVVASWGCSGGGTEQPEVAVDAEVTQPPTPPRIPQPFGPDDDPADAEVPMPPTPRPRAGAVVLVHLEGPITDPQATDVVVRTERGTEVDRFRLPGAAEIHAGPAGHWALIVTNTGQWARYDAVSGELTWLTFEGDAPSGTPRVQGAVAWWEDPDQPWLVRLDTGMTRTLRDDLTEGGRVVAATADGAHLLVVSDGDHIIDTADGTVRTLPPQTSVTLSTDGTRIASTAAAVEGTDVYLEGIDGSDRRLIATVPDDGLPVLLEDGRVLVLGATSQLIQPDGTVEEFPPVPGASDPVVAADGHRVIVTGEAGLVLVDPSAATVQALQDTGGWSVYADGPRTVLWTASEDPSQPGAMAVDPASGENLSLLADTPTGQFLGISDDGRTVLLEAGGGTTDRSVLTADGETFIAQGVTDAALHPDGSAVAVGVIDQVTRSLLIGEPVILEEVSGADVELPTGRSPVWLKTEG